LGYQEKGVKICYLPIFQTLNRFSENDIAWRNIGLVQTKENCSLWTLLRPNACVYPS